MAYTTYVLTVALLHAYTAPSTALLVSTMALQDKAQDELGKPDMNVSCDDGRIKDWFSACPFTIEKLVSHKPTRSCQFKILSDDGIAALAVPRTGSETLVASIKAAKGHKGVVHDHVCTMSDLIAKHATRVVMSLRPPDERIVSAYAHGSEGFGKFPAHRGASHGVHNAAINEFLDALRDVDHPRHVEAVDAVKKQPFFLYPAAEFYLDDNHLQGKPAGVDLEVLCTCDLNKGIEALASKWNFTYIPTDIESPHGKDDHYHPTINPKNQAWIRSVYAKDYALHKHWCAKCR